MTTLTRPQATDFLDGAGTELDLVLAEYADLIEATEAGLAGHDHAGGDGAQIAYAGLSGLPTLGTAAALDVGTTANKLIQIDALGKLPAVDGSQLTNLPAVVTDHGALTGLSDDDHSQYHTDARGDARYSVLAHNHAGTYEASGAVTTHASLTSAVHGITAFGASLVDDANAADARTTLGLGGAASLNVGTVAGTVAAGDDARIVAAAPETASTIGTLIAGSADKATPVDADSLAISDSAAAGILKRLSWANVKAGLNSFYARLAGAAGGQTLTGGTAAGENLTLLSTSNATKGAVIFGTASEYDHVNDRIGVGTLTPAAKIHALSTTEQFRLGFDASNFASTTVSAAGVVANTATGGQWTYSATSSSATLGTELISNGTFASDLASWTDSGASWSWSSGTALHTAGSSTTLTQAENVTNGSTYQIGITITGRTAGSIAVDLGAVSAINSGTTTAFTSTFTRTVVAEATGSVDLVITPTSDFNGAIDNVTLRLVTLGSFSPVIVLSDSAGTASVELRASTASLSSVAVGLDAQRSLTTGSNNSAIGRNAQYSLTTGSSNSAIGLNAQRYLANASAAATIADNSVYIGSNTKQSADSVTNENVFGYNATGLGSNTVAIGDLNVSRTGLRGSVDIVASSSTTAGVTQAALVAAWTDSTHATRKARLTLSAYDTAAREAIRAEADGTVARLGFYGATAVVKPTALTATVAAAPAGGTGAAAGGWDTAENRDLAIATINNLKTRVDQLESKLQALGLLT